MCRAGAEIMVCELNGRNWVRAVLTAGLWGGAAVGAVAAENELTAASFERVTDFQHFFADGIEVSTNRAMFGNQSLKWSFRPNAPMTVSNIRVLSEEESGAVSGSQYPSSPTFVMSVYNETPTNDFLRVSFNERVHFDLNLGFEGWRTVWVPFYEMKGRSPRKERSYTVKSIVFTAPKMEGSLWFDDIVFGQYIDDRYPYPGLEVPFVRNGGAQVRDPWMPKVTHWEMLQAVEPEPISPEIWADILEVEAPLWGLCYHKPAEPAGFGYFAGRFLEEGILAQNGSPRPLKLPVQVESVQYARGFDGEPEYVDFRTFGKIMLDLANECFSTAEEKEREQLIRLFMAGTRYFLDQGWAAGSSQGTAYLAGYSSRELQTAFFVMRRALKENGLLEAVGDAVRWQLDFGITLNPAHLESDLEVYNTHTMYRLMSTFLTDNRDKHAALMRMFSNHLSSALALTDSQGFRPDGTAWHNWGHYPAFALGAFDRIPVCMKALAGTEFRISEAAHANFKRAFLAATIYSNPTYWGLGLSGAHPLGGNIGYLKEACISLAASGTPDGSDELDPDIAAAYLRLWGKPENQYMRQLFDRKNLSEKPPVGHWIFPYAALSIHRFNDWAVSIKGCSRYVWASEIEPENNRYGRYQSSGVVQILPNKSPEEAGYVEAGWDWNHPPGATTIELPFAELEPEKAVVRYHPLERFAGGCALNGNGVWAMKLNEAEGFSVVNGIEEEMSFEGGLQAHKSVFCFGRQLLCLGSDIVARDRAHPVHTTLFQNQVGQLSDTQYFDDGALLIDPNGNGYKIFGGSKVEVSVGEQTSPSNRYSLRSGRGSGAPQQVGNFAKAWIDHGTAPKKASYAYAVYPQTDASNSQELETLISSLPPLKILRQDSTAHVVEDVQNGAVAYACFEPGKFGYDLLMSVNEPCFVMTSEEGDSLHVAVSNPDLQLQMSEPLGRKVGQSAIIPVMIEIAGEWVSTKEDPAIIVSTAIDTTVITFMCSEGRTLATELARGGTTEIPAE